MKLGGGKKAEIARQARGRGGGSLRLEEETGDAVSPVILVEVQLKTY